MRSLRILPALLFLLLLGGCVFPSGDELLAAPKPSSNYQSLQTELEKQLAQGVSYASPSEGENRSSIQLADLDNDGVEEAITFFRGATSATSNKFTVAVYRKQDDSYVCTGTIDGRCRELTDKPFGVNIMLMHPQADEFAQIVVEEKVAVVTTGAGNPGKYVSMWKAAGIKVIPVVAAAVLARHLEPLGIDAVIAEGTESGGHVGEMTTMALVPQVVDAVSVPVIAAGGIADGRQLAAALALGACGVQVGTCLLASEECPIHPNYKAALLKAGDSDTIVTGRTVGAPVRVLKNRMSREYVRQEKAGADKMELEKYTLGSLRRAVFEGDTVSGSLMAGQVAGMLHEVRPVADILADLWQGGRQRIAALNTEC